MLANKIDIIGNLFESDSIARADHGATSAGQKSASFLKAMECLKSEVMRHRTDHPIEDAKFVVANGTPANLPAAKTATDHAEEVCQQKSFLGCTQNETCCRSEWRFEKANSIIFFHCRSVFKREFQLILVKTIRVLSA